YILSDLVQVGKMDESIALARAVQRAVVATTRSRYPYVTDLGVKRGPLYVLVGAYMPCVLVETSFLTHPMEGRWLARDDYPTRPARAGSRWSPRTRTRSIISCASWPRRRPRIMRRVTRASTSAAPWSARAATGAAS